ncbi:MAG: substrate-binding domain-containing protein [Actinomyces urogenitalis]|uniref:substrate-binding domain-containing protein n=1 Tax=Actinomyces urogenitalis TaxID=103621 RepID=UPI002A82B9C4|nr:substrate-binding domain-containing protein [Actinomyces urogenitalis]MDY3679522.1 substrate-binding domain-containing protein [Actinomyces urogenitalis]
MRHTTRQAMAGFACAALAIGAMTACTSGQESSEGSAGTAESGPVEGAIDLVYLQKQGDQQYFVDQADGAKAQAEKMGDVNISVLNLGTDANKAISEVDAAIARGVDGIIIVAPDQAIGPQILGAASAAGVPVLASDDPLEDGEGNAAPFVGFDGTSMGNSVGEEVARLYQEAGWSSADTAIISAFKQDLSVCVQRVEGAKESFETAVDDVPPIIDVGTDNSPTNAMDKTGAVITSHPEVKHWVVWGCNDQNTTGAVTGLQNAGFGADDILGVGLGADLACKDWAAGEVTGNHAALFISGAEVGKSAVEVMVTSLREGAALPAFTLANTAMVNAANFLEAGVKCQ